MSKSFNMFKTTKLKKGRKKVYFWNIFTYDIKIANYTKR